MTKVDFYKNVKLCGDCNISISSDFNKNGLDEKCIKNKKIDEDLNEIIVSLEKIILNECVEVVHHMQIAQKSKSDGFNDIADEFEGSVLRKMDNLSILINLLNENNNKTIQETIEQTIFEKYDETKEMLKLSKRLKLLECDFASEHLEKMYKEENTNIKKISKLFFENFKSDK